LKIEWLSNLNIDRDKRIVTWKSVAVIQIGQRTQVVHQAVVLHQVDHQAVVLHRVLDHHDQVQLTRLVVQRVLIQLDLHQDHQDQIQIAVAKIYQRAVVHHLDQVRQVEIAKAAMQVIRAEFVQHQWIAINHGYVQEFLSQIFRKMLQVKNSRKLLAPSY
jgi:hypothetical protein